MNYALILAGGIGSRFWPLSRQEEPKQFFNLCSRKSMVEETICRLSGLIKKEDIYIATNKIHNQKIKRCAESLGISFGNILFEPEGKNTLAPICLLSKKISDRDPEAVIVVLPSDHYIKDDDAFLKSLKSATEVARQGHIVTLGVPPQRPETGYGYIKIKSKVKSQESKFYKVDSFIEKPNLRKAKEFLKDKRYYWNCGIFIFRADVALEEVSKFAPGVYKIIMKIKNDFQLRTLWPKLPSVSFDYAVMEKTKTTALLVADYGWMDLGSWEALDAVLKKDKNGNIFRGNCVSLDNKNTFIWSDERLVAALGLDNLIIVNTEDALLVCRKDKSQDVKKVVQILKLKKCREQI